jgi:hypothetical protein
LLNASVIIALIIYLEFLFNALILPSRENLGSFGTIHDAYLAWLWRAWEGLRVCWDNVGWAVLTIGYELVRVTARTGELQVARVFVARPPDEEVVVDEEGNRRGDNVISTSMNTREASPHASHSPPPPYNVSVHYMNWTAVLTVTPA